MTIKGYQHLQNLQDNITSAVKNYEKFLEDFEDKNEAQQYILEEKILCKN